MLRDASLVWCHGPNMAMKFPSKSSPSKRASNLQAQAQQQRAELNLAKPPSAEPTEWVHLDSDPEEGQQLQVAQPPQKRQRTSHAAATTTTTTSQHLQQQKQAEQEPQAQQAPQAATQSATAVARRLGRMKKTAADLQLKARMEPTLQTLKAHEAAATWSESSQTFKAQQAPQAQQHPNREVPRPPKPVPHDASVEEGQLSPHLHSTHLLNPSSVVYDIDTPDMQKFERGCFLKCKIGHIKKQDPDNNKYPFILGTGAFGKVTLAVLLEGKGDLQRRYCVAVKEAIKNTDKHTQTKKDLLAEIANWKVLSNIEGYSQHLPLFYGILNDNSMVMEALWDNCWHRAAENKSPCMTTRVAHALQLTKALIWLHSTAFYIHTDLKLDNVGVRPFKGGIVLTDVGDCKKMDSKGCVSLRINNPNMPPHFWHAPERKEVKKHTDRGQYCYVDYKIDLYSLGTCLVTLLWGYEGHKHLTKSHSACAYRVINPKLDFTKLKMYELLRASEHNKCRHMAIDFSTVCLSLLHFNPTSRPMAQDVSQTLQKHRMWNSKSKKIVNSCLERSGKSVMKDRHEP